MASAAATARSARSTLAAFSDCVRSAAMKSSVVCPVACSHCSMAMPCAWNCCTVFCTRPCRSPVTMASGASTSTRSASAEVIRSRNTLRTWLSLLALSRSATEARYSSTVELLATFSSTHSSVRSGSTISCTLVTVTSNSASCSVPLGVALKRSSAPFAAPTNWVSKPSATQPRPTSYSQSSVFRPGTGSPSRNAASVRVT